MPITQYRAGSLPEVGFSVLISRFFCHHEPWTHLPDAPVFPDFYSAAAYLDRLAFDKGLICVWDSAFFIQRGMDPEKVEWDIGG